MFTTVVLPAPFEPSRAKMLRRATSKSTSRSTFSSRTASPGPARGSPGPAATSSDCPFFFSGVFSLSAFDSVDQPLPLPGDVPARLVVRNQRPDELDRVVPDDLADRRSIRRCPFEQVGEVFE